MKDSALLLLAGVCLCVLTLAGALGGMPTFLLGVLCLSGVGFTLAAMYEMIVNFN